MKLGLIGKLFPLMFSKVVYGYTAEALPELDMRAFQKKHKQEYEAMVKRTPFVGSMKDNMFAARNAPRNGNTPWTGSSISPMTLGAGGDCCDFHVVKGTGTKKKRG